MTPPISESNSTTFKIYNVNLSSKKEFKYIILITLLIINLLLKLVVSYKYMNIIINCIEYFQISCKFIHDLIILA